MYMSKLTYYQKQIDDFLERENYHPKYWSPHEMLAQLTEEVGEVARVINRDWGPKPKKDGDQHELLEKELGDVLFAIICLANSADIDLDESIQATIEKAMTRDLHRFPRKNET